MEKIIKVLLNSGLWLIPLFGIIMLLSILWLVKQEEKRILRILKGE